MKNLYFKPNYFRAFCLLIFGQAFFFVGASPSALAQGPSDSVKTSQALGLSYQLPPGWKVLSETSPQEWSEGRKLHLSSASEDVTLSLVAPSQGISSLLESDRGQRLVKGSHYQERKVTLAGTEALRVSYQTRRSRGGERIQTIHVFVLSQGWVAQGRIPIIRGKRLVPSQLAEIDDLLASIKQIRAGVNGGPGE